MEKRLKNKVVVITGGSSGIGLATAKRFVEEGAFVFIFGRRQKELNEAVRFISRNVRDIQGDVTSHTDLDNLFATVKHKKGRIDILIANAGVANYIPVDKVTEQDYDTMFNTNVKGLFFTVQKALPLMQSGSSIILISSVVSGKGSPNNSIYSATKAAVRSFARTLTSDLKSRSIRVNAVSPGETETRGLMNLLKNSEFAEQRSKIFTNSIPVGRLGRPEEIANAILFMASNESSYITGIELAVDGGMAQI